MLGAIGGLKLAVEVSYEGSYRLPAPNTGEAKEMSLFPGPIGLFPGGRDAPQLRSGATRQVSAATEATLSSLGSWVASLLVRLADLDLEYLPPVEPDAS